MTSPPLLVVGHGTRSAEGVAAFHALVTRLARRLDGDGIDVAGGFIELSAPPVTDAVASLVGLGHPHVVAVPLVLVAAGHGKGDIPAAMVREQVRHPGLTYAYGRPLGPHPALQDLLEARIDATLGDDSREDTAVVLVGRGSTDPDANAEIAKVARLLWEGRGYAFVEPSFISLAEPAVPAALERARRLGASRVVVAPYFLFAGVLPDRIVAQSAIWVAAHPDIDVRVAGVLGDTALDGGGLRYGDPLADLVVERYLEAIRGDIRMNCDTCLYRVALPGVEGRVGAPQRPHDHPHDPAGDTHSHTGHSHAGHSHAGHFHAGGGSHAHHA